MFYLVVEGNAKYYFTSFNGNISRPYADEEIIKTKRCLYTNEKNRSARMFRMYEFYEKGMQKIVPVVE